MKAVKMAVRSVQQVLADGLYPVIDGVTNPKMDDRRHQAVAAVLCRLPESAYDQLKEAKGWFEWFIPDIGIEGRVYPFCPNMPRGQRRRARRGMKILSPYARVVYLPPLLELRAWDSIVVAVAHELCHVVLKHAIHCHGDEAENCEKEVFRLLCDWGFEREVRRAEALLKGANTSDVPASEKLDPLMPLVWAIGIETLLHSQDERPNQACIEFAASGDAEMFLNLVRRNYKLGVEQWDEGGDGEHAFRVRLLVYFPISDIPGLMEAFADHQRQLPK
ncbi:MAG TPA: hypothetical protein VKD72_04430 [Gemmataceae bacterium]|nr:hypothetical protein [Gemmataceae bacterium]